ncbi:aminoglycoside phosphotransferase family protein [Actinoplanes sp. NPDC026619]|uniref:aminoglycoside phosphotransferase family protein n=1 Tax=Actinoplanes sp. NPDC026619 TaxID=3155798 RepID=UPI00340C3681
MRGSEDGAEITVPQSFRDMPRWWRGGTDWLDELPGRARTYGERWHLTITGEMTHGSNAAIIPVTRAGERLVLRLEPPSPAVAAHAEALRFWNGRGTVQLIDADVNGGAMLLEQLGASLHTLPVTEAIPILGRMMRRLAIKAPQQAPNTADVIAKRLPTLPTEWERHGRPFPETTLHRALKAGASLARTESQLAVNGDLHSAQILRGTREPWLTVDPVLMRGDIDYDLARLLWTRIDEMPAPTDILQNFESAVAAAELTRDQARDCLIYRTTDYWLWSLTAGLTEDPQRCQRLLTPFTEA